MITKVISGGQSGADQGARHAAKKLGVPFGGRIPEDRPPEERVLPFAYTPHEMPAQRTLTAIEKNILESDGTLILTHGRLTGGSLLTKKLCKRHKKPWLHKDLTEKWYADVSSEIHSWVVKQGVEILNVAGPRADKDPLIYESTLYVVEAVLLLSLVEADAGAKLSDFKSDELLAHFMTPKSIDQAIDQMLHDLDTHQRDSLSRLEEEELPMLHMNLGLYVRSHFQLLAEPSDLLEDCRRVSGNKEMTADDASDMLVKRLWEFLRQKSQ
ncbi:MAG: putative molybdenum carrier protein [Desulfobacterales bacterium]|jgi:hypothetical protein